MENGLFHERDLADIEVFQHKASWDENIRVVSIYRTVFRYGKPSFASQVAIYGVIMAIIMSNKMQGVEEFTVPSVPRGWQVPRAAVSHVW